MVLIKIDDINKSNELSGTKAARRIGSGENFAQYLNISKNVETQNVHATAAMTSADAIFAAQSITDEERKQIRDKLLKKGKNLLDKLDEIRDGLLVGEIAKEKLIEISRFVKQRDLSSDDERLNEILAEIELRVEVELAKLMR